MHSFSVFVVYVELSLILRLGLGMRLVGNRAERLRNQNNGYTMIAVFKSQ